MRFPVPVALLLALIGTPALAGQYETIDYHVQQMITYAASNDASGVLTFREQLGNLRRPQDGDANQARPLLQQGESQMARGNAKEAMNRFRQAFIADPTDANIAVALGSAYARLQRWREAERLLVYALSLAPEQSAAWLALGEVYAQAGDTQRATGAFANAYRFAADPAQLAEQLRQRATGDTRDTVRIGALQALRLMQPGENPVTANPATPAPVTPATPSTNTTDPPANSANLLGALKRGLTQLATPPGNGERPAAIPVGTSAPPGNSGQQIYRRSLPRTCLIVTFRNGKLADLGSGLLVSADGLVLTNNHVIENAQNLAVRCGERESTAEVRRRGKNPDLALLTTSLRGSDSFILNETYSPDLIGLEVFVIGNPYGLEGTFSTGIISGLREMDGVRYLQISAPISPGNSGGPVILSDGTVIGIATMGLKVGQNLNFAIASAEVIASALFDAARMKHQPLQSKKP